MTSGRNPADGLIPDLVIGPVPTSKRRDRHSELSNSNDFDVDLDGIAQPAPGIRTDESRGIDLGDFDDHGGNAAIGTVALELAEPARQLIVAERDGTGTASQPWPTGQTHEHVSLSVEAIQSAAPYGEPPQHLLETPVYAWLVYREQTKLKRQLTKAQAGFEQAERGRDGALANWIDTLRPLLLEDSRFSRLLSALASDEVSLDTARAEFDRTLAKVALTDQSLDEEQRELEGRVETANAELQERTRTCADAERTLAREQAKRKRIDIEARAAGGISPPTFDQRTAEADRALALASDQLQEFQQNVAASERAYAALCLEQRRLADRKKAEGIAGSRHEQLLQQGILVSQRNLLQAKANIGRSVLALRESRYLDDLTRCVLLQHDDEVSQATLRHRALLTQLGGFDRQAVRQGLWLSIGTLVLGLLLAMASIVC